MTFDRLDNPWMLGLAPLALLALTVSVAMSRGGGVLFPRTRATLGLGASWRTVLAPTPVVARTAAVVALAIVAARPQDVSGRRRERTEGVALQLVIDRSGSMDDPTRLNGRTVTRLEAVKALATEFVTGDGRDLRGREGDLLGVIAFGSYPDTICPLIRDHGPIPELIERIEILPVTAERGTAIGDAIALAAARLRSVEQAYRERARDQEQTGDSFEIKSKAIVLLTDGADRDSKRYTPQEAARLAAEWGVRIYAIGIGSDPGDDALGRMMRLSGPTADMRTLNGLAQATGGRAWPIESAEQLRAVYAEIDELERSEIERETYSVVEERYGAYAALGFGLLLLEALLRLLVFRRTIA